MKRRAFLKSVVATTLATSILPQRASSERSSDLSGEAYSYKQILVSNVEPSLYYQPKDGRVGDVIPFYDGEQFRIFHLYRADNDHGGTTWHQVSTRDFVHFTEHGTMLPRGTPEEQDLSVATGSVIKDQQGRYHIFYTGYNTPNKANKPEQGVMHAVSHDLLNWTKLPVDTFYAPTSMYERDDWRDPFVFWNAKAAEYWMLVAARLNTGPHRRRGCTALCTSKDLTHWKVGEPFWAPSLYFTHECPDLFRIGEWWYLIFSEFSEGNQTRYRMSRNITGPWLAPEDDVFDTRAFYAAKTASNGKERFLFGWNPRKTGATDDGKWEWGGTLVVHQLLQRPSGELYVGMPAAIDKVFDQRAPLDIRPALGKCEAGADRVIVSAPDSFGIATLAPLPVLCKVTATIEFAHECRDFGLMLKLQDDLDTCYYLRFEPARNRVVLDTWPRPGDIPFTPGFERPLKFASGKTVEVQVILDGTIAEFYVNGEVAISARMYRHDPGLLGAFVDEGNATFEKLSISLLEAR